ncbi:uncharacterized protein LOC116197918 [Punica granatum]|uniref:Uncharacterized protein LOC116197918 n=1 Tax=Punica granatum TaxID=22663 RepID=A0A6P8CXB3_PUNGR|nr:uncharacterized protein LOC116197918 [Punica granatum]
MGLLLQEDQSLELYPELTDLSAFTDNFTHPHLLHMIMLVWNCSEATNHNFRRTVLDLVSAHRPNILLLTEIRVDGERVAAIARSLPFNHFHCTKMIGFSASRLANHSHRQTGDSCLG